MQAFFHLEGVEVLVEAWLTVLLRVSLGPAVHDVVDTVAKSRTIQKTLV